MGITGADERRYRQGSKVSSGRPPTASPIAREILAAFWQQMPPNVPVLPVYRLVSASPSIICVLKLSMAWKRSSVRSRSGHQTAQSLPELPHRALWNVDMDSLSDEHQGPSVCLCIQPWLLTRYLARVFTRSSAMPPPRMAISFMPSVWEGELISPATIS